METTKTYDLTFFEKLFRKTRQETWNSGYVWDDETNTHCAIGHINKTLNGNPLNQHYEGVGALDSIFFNAGLRSTSFPEAKFCGWIIADINNGNHPMFQEPTPKKRIMSALQYVKSKLN